MPRTYEQNKEIKNKRKESLLSSLYLLFLKYRYEDIDISLICEYAKIKRTLFYHYFSSKEDLFCEIYKRNIPFSFEIVSKINQENKPKFKLIELINNIENLLKTNDENLFNSFYLYLKTDIEKIDCLPPIINSHYPTLSKLFKKYIKEASKNNEINIEDDSKTIINLLYYTYSMCLYRINGNNKKNINFNTNSIFSLFFN
ncbi:MAG: TetR/AcrR family transcriptional regulator [Bacilli bacterium]